MEAHLFLRLDRGSGHYRRRCPLRYKTRPSRSKNLALSVSRSRGDSAELGIGIAAETLRPQVSKITMDEALTIALQDSTKVLLTSAAKAHKPPLKVSLHGWKTPSPEQSVEVIENWIDIAMQPRCKICVSLVVVSF